MDLIMNCKFFYIKLVEEKKLRHGALASVPPRIC